MHTIRQGKIIEIDRGDLKSHETLFDTKIDAVKYTKEKEFYSDPQRGNDPERAKHISSELHAKENQFKDLVELSKNYGVKIENTHQELDREIRLREKPGAEKQGKSQAVRQSKTAAPGIKIDIEKTAKQFRSKDVTKQPVQKSKGRER